ncbi:hypothetical protein C0J52_10156 [Blattella germanica]|nr:hypothetical protein C0J52_10156 [Blattella germanica]
MINWTGNDNSLSKSHCKIAKLIALILHIILFVSEISNCKQINKLKFLWTYYSVSKINKIEVNYPLTSLDYALDPQLARKRQVGKVI